MNGLFQDLFHLLPAVWWPFCRFAAAFSAAPILGETLVPVRARLMLSLVLSMVMLPHAHQIIHVDPLSITGIFTAISEAILGFIFGFALYLVHAAMMLLGYLISSQMGLSMAVMNDPISGTASDVLSQVLFVLSVLIFFSFDGHLVVTHIVYSSFELWPVGSGIKFDTLHAVAGQTSWLFGAAFLLALPSIFSTFVVQLGFGLLNRIAPTLNLFSLGFPLVTLFGLLVLIFLIHSLPDHYVRMSNQIINFLDNSLRTVPHG